MLKLNWRIARRLDSLCCAARFSESTQVPEATADVIYEKQGKTQQVFLNRPGQHNSINLGMLQSILKNAKKWNSDQSTNFITFQGKGRSFCSGGDLKSHFANWNTNSAQTIKNIDSHMKTEFTLQYYLANLRPVTISLMNGYVMGGATCLSALSPIRIVTETTKFAMPGTMPPFPSLSEDLLFQADSRRPAEALSAHLSPSPAALPPGSSHACVCVGVCSKGSLP